MKNTPEIYLIGQRIKRKILMIMILISVLLGVIVGNECKSLIFGLFLSVVLAFFQIVMTRKYYWIISNQGIYTPLNFGIKNYLIIMLKYLLCGDDTGNIVFVNYRTIAYLNLFERKNKLWVQIIRKNGDFISITIESKFFNQDLVNAVIYIKRKGIVINGLEVLKEIKNKIY